MVHSEYLGVCVSDDAVLLDNTVPSDMYEKDIRAIDYSLTDTFMGFHCGNTPSEILLLYEISEIMARSLEPNQEPNTRRGTLEVISLPELLHSSVYRVQPIQRYVHISQKVKFFL